MNGQKLVLIANKMNGVEKRAFSRFLASPYYNQRPELSILWKLLLQSIKGSRSETANEDPDIFKPDTVLKVIYGNESKTIQDFRHLCSWLLKKIEQFFVVRQHEKATIDGHLALAKTYREKKLDHLFKKKLELGKKEMLQQRLEPNRFLTAYEIEFEQYAFIESQNRTGQNNLQDLNDSLDLYLLVSKLKQSCLMLSHQAVYKVTYDFSFLDAILAYLKDNPLLENPAIALYYHCYLAFNENNFDHFQSFKNILTKHQADFSPSETRGLLLFALNFCIRQINKDDDSYAQEAWDFYRLGLDQRLLYVNDYLGRFTFKNIVALSIKLKKFDWAEKFISEYSVDINPKYRENYLKYNEAQLDFARGNYTSAMPLLATLDDSDLLLNFDAKVILIKMYFELSEIDALYSLLDSFSAMLRRKKLVGYHKTYYKSLIQLTKKLLDLNHGPSDKKNLLRKEVQAMKQFPEREWFMKMIA